MNFLSQSRPETTCLDELEDVIRMPCYNSRVVAASCSSASLDANVKAQVFEFVSRVAAMYPYNRFHSFEHVSNTTLNVSKTHCIGNTGIPCDHVG